jgi:hypothetical protein
LIIMEPRKQSKERIDRNQSKSIDNNTQRFHLFIFFNTFIYSLMHHALSRLLVLIVQLVLLREVLFVDYVYYCVYRSPWRLRLVCWCGVLIDLSTDLVPHGVGYGDGPSPPFSPEDARPLGLTIGWDFSASFDLI